MEESECYYHPEVQKNGVSAESKDELADKFKEALAVIPGWR